MDLSGGPRYLKLSDNVKSRGQIVLIECDSNGDIDSISQRGYVTKAPVMLQVLRHRMYIHGHVQRVYLT